MFLGLFYKFLDKFPMKPQFLELFYKYLINSQNVCIENVNEMFFKHYSVNPKGRV